MRNVLRTFLGSSRTIDEYDRLQAHLLKLGRQCSPQELLDAESSPTFTEYERRLIRHFAAGSDVPTWEGLTWVIDLLPHHPEQAIAAIQGYLLAHAQVLPDLRLCGLADAADLIRVRYIIQGTATFDSLLELLLTINPRDFEFLVAHLYRSIGYDVFVTAAQKDGGKDVIASRDGEIIYIECKNWEGRVDVKVVAELIGRVEVDRVTRGIVVGTSGFTKGRSTATEFAVKNAARVSLVDGVELIRSLNANLGSAWHTRIERLLNEEKAAQARA